MFKSFFFQIRPQYCMFPAHKTSCKDFKQKTLAFCFHGSENPKYSHKNCKITRSAEEEWKIKREVLLQKREYVRSVDVKEALRLQKENNFVILDVPPEAEFTKGHPEGAINVQIYRLIKEWTAWDLARRAAFAFFGIFGEQKKILTSYKVINLLNKSSLKMLRS